MKVLALFTLSSIIYLYGIDFEIGIFLTSMIVFGPTTTGDGGSVFSTNPVRITIPVPAVATARS